MPATRHPLSDDGRGLSALCDADRGVIGTV
jgi:hypothetical protein